MLRQRLRSLVRIPNHVNLKEAVVGTLTVNLPLNFLYSGAVEIVIQDVRVAVELPPPPKDDASSKSPSPPLTPRPGDTPPPVLDDAEFPHTAEELAKSFLDNQTEEERRQLMSLYVENKDLASSVMSSASSSVLEDDDDELGLGDGLGVVNIFAGMFNGIADRMIVKIKNTKFSLDTTLSEERGGEKVLFELEVNDLDVEGVSRSATGSTLEEDQTRPRRQGKRRITLEEIRGYITTSASMYGIDVEDVFESGLFESAHMKSQDQSPHKEDEGIMKSDILQNTDMTELQASINTVHQSPSPEPSPPKAASPRPPSRSPSPEQPRTATQSAFHTPRAPSPVPPPLPQDSQYEDADSRDSFYSDTGDQFYDDENSDEEVLLPFVAPSMMRSTVRHPTMRRSMMSTRADSSSDDDDAEGGVKYRLSAGDSREMDQSMMSASYLSNASFRSAGSSQSHSPPPRFLSPDLSQSRLSGNKSSVPQTELSNMCDGDSSGDEMDQAASQMLSQSMYFSKEEASSLYMSATSGIFRSRSDASRTNIEDVQEEEEEIDAEEMDRRLEKFMTVSSDSSKSIQDSRRKSLLLPPPPPKMIRRECINIDLVTMFYPSLVGEQLDIPEDMLRESEQPSSSHQTRTASTSSDHQMPGAFSAYTSPPTQRSPRVSDPSTSKVQHRSPPTLKFVDAGRVRPAPPDLSALQGETGKKADIEIIAANIHGLIDIPTEKVLLQVIEAIQDAMAHEDSAYLPLRKKKKPELRPKRKKSIQLIVEEIDVRVVKQLAGIFVETGDIHIGDPTVQLQVLLNDVKIHRHGRPDDGSNTKAAVKRFAMKDKEEGIITFLPKPASADSNKAKHTPSDPNRKRAFGSNPSGRTGSHGSHAAAHQDRHEDVDIVVNILEYAGKWRIDVQTLPLRIRGDLKRLEETLALIGGISGLIASTTVASSTATITKGATPWRRQPDEPKPKSPAGDIKIDIKMDGLLLDVIGSTATASLGTSPIGIQWDAKKGLKMDVEMIDVAAPEPHRRDISFTLEGTHLEFAEHPSHDDLTRLLELLTPSKDSFDDDDILIDTLLRQREQGSVVRISIDKIKGHLIDTMVFEKLKQLGDDVVQLISATPFVAGDERPGLLTLISVGMISGDAQMGAPLGRIRVELMDIGITHVTAPMLVATHVGDVRVLRNDMEVVGMGMERERFQKQERERKCIMVRMVGEELEPVVKVKFWNLRVEYDVNMLMELMEKPVGTTSEEVVQDMVNSIIGFPDENPQPIVRDSDAVGLGFDIAIKDSVIALNPLNSKSKALVVLTDSRFQAAVPNNSPIQAAMEINKASLLIIDDALRLSSPADPFHLRYHRSSLSHHIAAFTAMGYAPVITLSSAKAVLNIIDNAVDLEVNDDLILIESCADSTQTLIQLGDGLSPPKKPTEEIKYAYQVMPVDDLMKSVTQEGFFVASQTGGSPEDFLEGEEDLPTQMNFVDSYYGHRQSSSSGNTPISESLGDALGSSMPPKTPMLSRDSSGGSTFSLHPGEEKVTVLDETLPLGEIAVVEDYFKPPSGSTTRRAGKRSLNAEAVAAASYFPLQLRLREVHVIWKLYDGYDWASTRDAISQAVTKVEARATAKRSSAGGLKKVAFDVSDADQGEDECSVVEDFLFNSIYIGVPANRDPKELRTAMENVLGARDDTAISESSYRTESALGSTATGRSRSTTVGYDPYGHPQPQHSRHGSTSTTTSRSTTSGRSRGIDLGRSRKQKVQIELSGVDVDFLLFPPDSGEVVSSVEVRVRDLEIFDHVPTSTWRKFVTYCRDAGERELGSDMVRLECLVVKPVKELAATELVIKVIFHVRGITEFVADSVPGQRPPPPPSRRPRHP